MAKSVAPSAPAHLTIALSLLGTREIKGKKANPIIAGASDDSDWFATVGRGEIDSDEVANCAAFVGNCLVKANKGYPLPPKDQRLLARGYCDYGIDARRDPAPGDIFVIPRGASWQGHVMLIVAFNHVTKIAKCIGANQGDAVTYAEHHISEAIAIRRPVPATVKDLRVAGSTEIKAGDTLQNVGAVATVAPTAVVAAAKAVEAVTAAPVVPVVPDPAALDALRTTATKTVEGLGLFTSVGDAAASAGKLFVANPWIVLCMAIGIVVIVVGHELKRRRVAKAAAGLPLSNQIATV